MNRPAPHLFTALLLLSGCAPARAVVDRPSATPAAADSRQCFPVDSVTSFNAVDRETVNLRVGGRDIYQMKLFAPCHDINWSLAVGLRARGGGSFICDAMDIDVVAPSVSGPQLCRVSALRRLTEAEVAALPRGQLP